eukprot:1522629-Pyramimonas_sp.AAC.1
MERASRGRRRRWSGRRIGCLEGAKRRAQNFAGAVDLRPATDEDFVKREDELHSDEELDPRIVDPATGRKTRVGGAP